ncbi:MAG TPA: PAS domain S-box protein, partial [Nitrosomonas sp.]|nr:PAS domain S-box protein [Nitrosomonas sp.]
MKHNDDFADLSATELILKAENAMLKIQLEEKEETLRAIQCGEIDALVVQSQSGPQVYTLQGLDAELNRFRGEILERISEAIIVLNEDHHIVYINAAAEKMYGIKSPAILGAPICMLYQTQWLHPYDEAEMVTQLNEKGHWNGERLHLKTSGEIIHIEILVTRLPQNIKPCYSDILVIRDITERKKVGDRIRADAERLACVLAAQRQIAAAELDGPNLLQLILKTMARITGADGASIEMLEGDMVNCEAAIGVAEPFIGLKLQTKDTLSEICISSGKLQRVDDIENKLSENLTFSRTNDIKSLVMIPLRYGKNLFGLLKLFSSRLKTF